MADADYRRLGAACHCDSGSLFRLASPKRGDLSDRQRRYAAARARGIGQTQAAMEAGYAKASANVAGSKLAKHAGVMAAIAAARVGQPQEPPKCHCGEPLKLRSGRGAQQKYCGKSCRPSFRPLTVKPVIACIDCGAAVTTKSASLVRCGKCRAARTLRSERVCAANGCDVKFFASAASKRKFCGLGCNTAFHNAKTATTLLEQKCSNCGVDFLGVYRKGTCSDSCSREARSKATAKWAAELPLKIHVCRVCSTQYTSTAKQSRHCSNVCKMRAFKERTGVYAEQANRALEREKRRREREAVLAATRAAKRINEAAEKAASAFWAAELAELRAWADCRNCGVRFRKTKRNRTCSAECSRYLGIAARHADRIARKAILKAARVDSVSPFKVFARDNWKCYLCGCDTPKSLRGTYEPNAPEVEHVVPIARGGKDAYDNVRCACRQCNSIKGDRTLEEIGGAFVGG